MGTSDKTQQVKTYGSPKSFYAIGPRDGLNSSLAYNRIRSAQYSGRWSSDQDALMVHASL